MTQALVNTSTAMSSWEGQGLIQGAWQHTLFAVPSPHLDWDSMTM